jgi:hypothetical protein
VSYDWYNDGGNHWYGLPLFFYVCCASCTAMFVQLFMNNLNVSYKKSLAIGIVSVTVVVCALLFAHKFYYGDIYGCCIHDNRYLRIFFTFLLLTITAPLWNKKNDKTRKIAWFSWVSGLGNVLECG